MIGHRQTGRRHLDLPAEGFVEICITDTETGVGMPPEVVARVFDPFFTTEPIGRGMGLAWACR